jgi:diadenosine tetraphosphate (Ap4A) HIT family hydrolase
VSLERLWAGWRAEWVGSAGADVPDGECLFCGLSDAPPDEALVVATRERSFAVLNAYPYTSGHLMVAPLRHESDLERLPADEAADLMAATQQATAAVKRAYAPDAVNVGMNLGRAAGAGIPGHLHVHIVPRWSGDTNFMTSIAETRVLPETLSTTLERLRDAWEA